MAHYKLVRPGRGNMLYISAWLPSQAAIASSSSISLYEVCCLSSAPPQPFPCLAGEKDAPAAHLPFSDLLPVCRRHLCWPQSPHEPGPPNRVPELCREGDRGRRRERRGSFPSRQHSIPEGAGSQRLFGHIKQSSCVGFHMSGVPGSMTYGLIYYTISSPLPLASAVCFFPSLIHHLSSLQRARRNGFHLLPEPSQRLHRPQLGTQSPIPAQWAVPCSGGGRYHRAGGAKSPHAL